MPWGSPDMGAFYFLTFSQMVMHYGSFAAMAHASGYDTQSSGATSINSVERLARSIGHFEDGPTKASTRS